MARTVAHTSSLTVVPEALAVHRPLVLVIDPDESTRSVLEVALTRDGFDVWSAATGVAGMTLLQGRLPEVIVLETDLGGQDGFTFVAQLRGDDRLAKLPVLLLAKADDQNVEAMSDVVGVDDFLQKPAFARDVAAMVRLELARRERGEDEKAPLRFQTKVLPPMQLLRALMSCPRSGRLLLLGGRGEIRFRAGKVIDARIDGRGSNLDTVVRALALTSGEYQLMLEPIDGFAELQCSLRELVELVSPRLQKWVRVLQRSLPLESRLMVDFGRLAQGLKAMPDEVNRIVQLFDGFRTVEQVLIDSAFSETLTLEVATRLYLMGVLAPAKGADEELLVLRPMPRLFEPRATEQEELMRQLFAGTAEIRAEEGGPTDDPDWFAPLSHQTGLEVAEADGGWTTAPVPKDLAEGLSPELARQLDAFQTPMRVEPQPVAPEIAAAQQFAHAPSDVAVDTAMESAILKASDEQPVVAIERELNAVLDEQALGQLEAQMASHRAEAKGRQARIETPWMTPVVEVPAAAPAPAPSSEPTVQVSADAQPGRSVTPTLTPAVAPVGTEAQLRIPTPVLTPQAAAESAFFNEEAFSEAGTVETVPLKARRRVWPFVVGGLLLAGLVIAAELWSGKAEPAAAVAVPAPAPVVAAAPAAVVAMPADLPEVEPPVFIEDEAPVIDVSENLDEARKLYEAGQYKKAISVLEQVVTDDPKSVTGWNLLGLAKYDALDAAGARAAADKVLELDPKNGRVHILLATLHFDANEKDLGRAELEKYLALEPNGAHVEEAKALLKQR